MWYKRIRKNKNQEHKLETEWFEGIWLGHNRASNEILIGTTEGVVKAYGVRRMPEEDRWDGEMIKKPQGTPQQPNPSKPGDHIPIRIRIEESVKLKPDEENTGRAGEIRRFRITIPMLNKYGYTEGCEGCRFKQAGLDNGRAHSVACRKRLVEALKGDSKDAKALDRENERIAIRMADEEGMPAMVEEDEEENMGVDTSDVNIEIEGENNDEKDDAEMNDEPSNIHAAILGRIQ